MYIYFVRNMHLGKLIKIINVDLSIECFDCVRCGHLVAMMRVPWAVRHQKRMPRLSRVKQRSLRGSYKSVQGTVIQEHSLLTAECIYGVHSG